MIKKYLLASVICCSVLAGCVCSPDNPEALAAFKAANDPFEPTNRVIFGFNIRADKYVIKPLAEGYRYVAPQPVRSGVYNFFTNLRQPMYLINAALQGEGQKSVEITERFFTNTLFGFFGMADTASDMNIPVNDNDFGQTLYVWGIKDGGPFLMLPFLGPSNPRDTVGIVVDGFLAPIDWALYKEPFLLYSRIVLESFTRREKALDFLDSLEKSSTDYYATMRTMYQQNRKKKLEDTQDVQADNQKKDYEFDFPTQDE